jgi:hypothetical protein
MLVKPVIKLICIVVIGLQGIAVADDFSEMPDDVGRLEVFAHCSRCHSMQIVNQQGLSRTAWEKLMVWMVDEQGMTAMEDKTETLVVDYLSIHYSPDAQKERLRERGLLR